MAPKRPVSTGAAGKMKQGSLFSFFNKKKEATPAAATAPAPAPAAKAASNANANPYSKGTSASTTAKALAPSRPSAAASAPAKAALPSASTTAKPKTKTSTNNNNNNNTNNDKAATTATAPLTTGTRVEVYWPDDDLYYAATITRLRQRQQQTTSYLEYEDGQCEWIDLSTETYRVLSSADPAAAAAAGAHQQYESNKRRRIHLDDNEDDSDEEAEFDMDDASASDGSAYKEDPKANQEDDDEEEYDEEEEDDEDQWMVTDDEDDTGKKKKRKTTSKKSKAPTLQVTEHLAPTKTITSARSTTTTPSNISTSSTKASSTFVSPAASKNTLANFSYSAQSQSQLQSQSQSQSQSSQKPQETQHRSPHMPQPTQQSVGSPLATTSTTNTTIATTQKKIVPMYTKGAVNPAGSHVHNHLKFLQHRRDAQGRTPDHADYDPRTLKVVLSDWVYHCDKMTDAVKQWWDLKAQYMDTVLLFKTGKFYELFHMDADAGVQALGCAYMKGHVAHAGFPEISYGSMSHKLVLAGYKVARVEQTETPDMLKIRKSKFKKGRSGATAPKVVNREVCSVMTMGTRTFCFLDDESGIVESDSNGTGPLLAIREVLLDPMDVENVSNSNNNATSPSDVESAVQPVCEYGITLVDAVRGTVTLGQFADDVLRSRMNTLLATFSPSEILLEGGENGASPTLQSLIRAVQTTSSQPFRIETIRSVESFPKSTALDVSVQRKLEREGNKVHPWEVEETLKELHRRKYYPRASRKQDDLSVSRWPQVLRAAVEGEANLALSSFGATLYYLQRNLIDGEILSMGIVKAYVPPESSVAARQAAGGMTQLAAEQNRLESGVDDHVQAEPGPAPGNTQGDGRTAMEFSQHESLNTESEISHMSLDGTTLHNLEILTNAVDHKVAGSLWSKINHTKTPHGARLLRAWLLRPLFRKVEIDRRADAVGELVSGGAAVALSEATAVLAKCGDIERLLSRVHGMSGNSFPGADEDESSKIHPSDRAVLYENATYNKRKVSDFSRVLTGLRHAAQIPEIFASCEIESGLLCKIVRHADQGGCFPSMEQELDWFFENFDCDQAAKGLFEPTKGVDDIYDDACDAMERIRSELNDYKDEMCSNVLQPRSLARSSWKYTNTNPEQKDKYMIELPASVAVPDDFILKGKRGSGQKQVNKYRTADVEQFVQQMESSIDVQKERRALGMRLIFSKFDSMRTVWAAVAQTTAILDAVGSLARTASRAGFVRPRILECPPDGAPSIRVMQGRHPCVENTISSTEFVPNDLSLGSEASDGSLSRVLLLSGPNMGGKSTLLRQTCLITIMAQIGSFVPAEECELTPIDRIFTRLGASDRILLGQSTFFVELAETAAALRGATRRSLVIMDELGRGTSTFDGTAIASAAVKHLVDRSRCLSLFATHYHSLLDEWKDTVNVRLGHMECLVENGVVTSRTNEQDKKDESTITFLYTLGEGVCPKSFGINVARLAGLPEDVLSNAKRISCEFEEEMNNDGTGTASRMVTARSAPSQKSQIADAIRSGNMADVARLWQSLQG